MIIWGALAVLLLGIGMFEYVSTASAVPNVRDCPLKAFSYTRGGDMIGSFDGIDVRQKNDRLLVRLSKAKAHNEEIKTVAYQVDEQLLTDIEAVFRKYRMDRWHHKKFTDMFVADGASSSYSFSFAKEEINFHSQVYSSEYWGKLKEIHQLIDEYCQKGQQVPAVE